MLDEVINRAAFSAGVLLRDDAFSDLAIEWKPGDSPVTNLDKAAELLIREAITKELDERPNFIGEEYGSQLTGSRYTFRIDPIDGTKPFIRREFSSSVSIAAEIDGKPAAACVYDFMRGIAYCASDDGPYIRYNGKRHDIIRKNPLKTSLISTCNLEAVPDLVDLINKKRWKTSTRIGSIALVMAQVAAGVYDGIIEGPKNYAPHDVAAGAFLLEKAGFDVRTPSGEPFDYHDPTRGIIALREKALPGLDVQLNLPFR